MKSFGLKFANEYSNTDLRDGTKRVLWCRNDFRQPCPVEKFSFQADLKFTAVSYRYIFRRVRYSLRYTFQTEDQPPHMMARVTSSHVIGLYFFDGSVSGVSYIYIWKCWRVVKVFYSPTDAQLNCLKNNFKFYIKIQIKTAPTCFGAITIIRERIIRAG
jgi:hypothetical protein